MFVKIKKWYYKRCLKREIEKMEDFKNDPDYYLCGEGSKQAIEVQKCVNRILFYQFILAGHCGREYLSSWLKKNYPFDYLTRFEKVERCPEK